MANIAQIPIGMCKSDKKISTSIKKSSKKYRLRNTEKISIL